MEIARSTEWVSAWCRQPIVGEDTQWLEHAGTSMAPVLQPGDLVEIKRIWDGYELRVGDVVVARRGPILVTHRIVRIDLAGRVVTRGDASRVNDPPIERHSVIGRVVDARRSGRPLSLGAPTWWRYVKHRIGEINVRHKT